MFKSHILFIFLYFSCHPWAPTHVQMAAAVTILANRWRLLPVHVDNPAAPPLVEGVVIIFRG